MSANWKFKTTSGGSVTLAPEDSSTDDVVIVPKGNVTLATTDDKSRCTAWVNFDGTTTPPTIRDSFNVSDVVRTATGVFEIHFTEDMDNANYTIAGGAAYFDQNHVALSLSLHSSIAPNVTIATINTGTNGSLSAFGALVNSARSNALIFGGKA